MKCYLKAAGVLLLLAVLLGAVFLYAGVYDVGMLNHDNAAMNAVLRTAMVRSVRRHAKGLEVPDLSQADLIRAGRARYDVLCASCHAAPGVGRDETGRGLWPPAPDLARAAPEWTSAELFWITKNGIKFTAMPAWGPTHTDRQLWNIVAFLEALPRISPDAYKQMGGDT